MSRFDVEAIRRRFPALGLAYEGRPMTFFDGPGGTQVPDSVIDAVTRYYRESNANAGGSFPTSERSDAMAAEAHRAAVDLFGAADVDEITFGANMTSLTFHVSRSVGATMQPGDEIVVTGLDHEANIGPWRSLAAERGFEVRAVDVRLDDCTLDLESLDHVLGPRTKLVAVGWASNAVGTINPVEDIARRVHAAGALLYVDAVHFAPHVAMDVRAAGADLVACSAYKFFGPHVGILYGRADVLDRLPSYKIRPAHHRFATGTANFEGLAGTLAAIEYIAWLGRAFGGAGEAAPRRDAIVAGMGAIRRHEMELFGQLVDGLQRIPGYRLFGIADRARFADRTPTAAVRFDGVSPEAASAALGRQGIATWHGDFYATGLIERLGLLDDGGVLRIGLTHYNTEAEVDRLVEALQAIVAGRARLPVTS
jgi:cysteine desulfurase family protein (TIGR01976 family)